MILDEIQRAPELLSYVQGTRGRGRAPGQLHRHWVAEHRAHEIGVADARWPNRAPSASALLARRAARVAGAGPRHAGPTARSPRRPRQRRGPRRPSCGPRSWLASILRCTTGGLAPRDWLADYFRTYVERDLREVTQVLDLRAFETFVRLAAARTATELNLRCTGRRRGSDAPDRPAMAHGSGDRVRCDDAAAPLRELSQAPPQAPATSLSRLRTGLLPAGNPGRGDSGAAPAPRGRLRVLRGR